jgi:hypothetical protein
MSPQSNDVVDVVRATNVQIDLIAPHHPPLELRAHELGAHRKISRFLQKGRPAMRPRDLFALVYRVGIQLRRGEPAFESDARD